MPDQNTNPPPARQRPETHILGVSGSLRANSKNTALLTACRALSTRFDLYPSLATLPPFNPDLDPATFDSVQDWSNTVCRAGALLFSVPEYAGGIPGAFKNALDWLVGDTRFDGMPVGIINTSPRATSCFDSLQRVLRTMSGTLVDGAVTTIALSTQHSSPQSIIEDQSTKHQLSRVLEILRRATDDGGPS